MSDRRQHDHPWWQERLSTARRSTAYAVFYSLAGAAWIAVFVPSRLGDDPEAWLVVLGAVVSLGWVLLAAAHISGAVAQRREEARLHQQH